MTSPPLLTLVGPLILAGLLLLLFESPVSDDLTTPPAFVGVCCSSASSFSTLTPARCFVVSLLGDEDEETDERAGEWEAAGEGMEIFIW